MYIGWKKYCYAWDDLPCCGMADVDVGSVGNAVAIDANGSTWQPKSVSKSTSGGDSFNTNHRYVKTMVFFQA